ncbi:hypothetical protein SGRA_0900 [Saprospira grandis str. Lewin]|uniref:Uncharacterized protein n=1 Tax=Saprospira grandis (strain Lewin) TaxID=984262 RepID=H6L2H8_SAPGL|nr:hypothetical protein SGRA_0900 [Saprospira grandis str. Lewin]
MLWEGAGGEAAAGERSDRPSDVQGWPKARPKRAALKGRAGLRAPKRSAAALLRRPQKNRKDESV